MGFRKIRLYADGLPELLLRFTAVAQVCQHDGQVITRACCVRTDS